MILSKISQGLFVDHGKIIIALVDRTLFVKNE